MAVFHGWAKEAHEQVRHSWRYRLAKVEMVVAEMALGVWSFFWNKARKHSR